ncbi:MAG: N-acetylmuramoyl-L-alanine amidase family protein, partial [Acidimicrobiales bacterium]
GVPAPAVATTEPPPPPTTTTITMLSGTTLLAANPKVVVSASGVTLPVVGRQGDSLRVATPCERTALVSSGVPIAAAEVVLDAGHGGREPGAVGPNGLTEKELNLQVVEHAQAALERAGVGVVLTRPTDYRMTLGARAKVVEVLNPRAFVSVHHNAEPDSSWPRPGSETFYQIASAESKRLAGLIYEEVVKALSAYPVAWVADSDAGAKYRPSGTGDDYYGILRRTQGTPGVLAELAFISNPPEAELLARPDVRKVEGEAVAKGILRFLRTRDAGSGFSEPYPRSAPAGSGGGSSGCVDPAI